MTPPFNVSKASRTLSAAQNFAMFFEVSSFSSKKSASQPIALARSESRSFSIAINSLNTARAVSTGTSPPFLNATFIAALGVSILSRTTSELETFADTTFCAKSSLPSVIIIAKSFFVPPEKYFLGIASFVYWSMSSLIMLKTPFLKA